MWWVVLESLTHKMLHPDSGSAKESLLSPCLLNFPYISILVEFSFWDFNPLCLRVDDPHNQRSIEFLQSSQEFIPCLSRDLKYQSSWCKGNVKRSKEVENQRITEITLGLTHGQNVMLGHPREQGTKVHVAVTTNAYWLTRISIMWRG